MLQCCAMIYDLTLATTINRWLMWEAKPTSQIRVRLIGLINSIVRAPTRCEKLNVALYWSLTLVSFGGS